MRSNRSHTLGLVVPEMTNYGFAVISRELETLCREAGLQLLIACTDENPAQEMMAVNSLVQQQVDGLIVASSQLNDAEYQKINAGLPVQMDRLIAGSRLPLVITGRLMRPPTGGKGRAPTSRMRSIFSAGSRAFRRPAIGWPASSLARRAGVTCKPEWIINGSYRSSGYEMFAQLCAQLGRPPKRCSPRLWPAGRGVALSDAASADGERHPPVQLRRSLPVRLHDAEDRYGRARLPGAGAA